MGCHWANRPAFGRHPFKYSSAPSFTPLDKWVRMRLRSILRKRRDIRGVGRGLSNFRWPNKYFAEHGLFNLVAAHAQAAQPSRR